MCLRVSVTTVCRTKTDEPIEMQIEVQSRVVPRDSVLAGGLDSFTGWDTFNRDTPPAHTPVSTLALGPTDL